MMLAGCIYFAGIYLVIGGINWYLTRRLLPALHWGGYLDPRPLAKGQLQEEFRLSAVSIAIFGIGSVIPWGMLQLGWARLASDPTLLSILLEIIILLIWNEWHFYLCHRLLHTRYFRRFHLPHHRSIVTTPWACYRFHPVEALLLGSVPLLPMLIYPFSAAALLALPILSLIYNNIGHSNYDFLPWAKHDRWWLNGSRRHHLHHALYHGNYGFMLPFVDKLFGTSLPDNTAAPVAVWQAKQATMDGSPSRNETP